MKVDDRVAYMDAEANMRAFGALMSIYVVVSNDLDIWGFALKSYRLHSHAGASVNTISSGFLTIKL